MGDRVKERDRKGWKERGINYQSSSGRRDSPIKPYLSGIYNYIMMHPLPHQVNWQSLFSGCCSPSPHLSFFPLCQPFFFPMFSLPPLKTELERLVCEQWGTTDQITNCGQEDENVLLSSHSLQPKLATCPWLKAMRSCMRQWPECVCCTNKVTYCNWIE